jgi:hypothetical protein
MLPGSPAPGQLFARKGISVADAKLICLEGIPKPAQGSAAFSKPWKHKPGSKVIASKAGL